MASTQTLRPWRDAVSAAQHANETLFTTGHLKDLQGGKGLELRMLEVRGMVSGIVDGQSKILQIATSVANGPSYEKFLDMANGAVAPVESWVAKFTADTERLKLSENPDAQRRADAAIQKLAKHTRTLAVLVAILDAAIDNAANDSSLDLGDIDLDGFGNDLAPGETSVMKAAPPVEADLPLPTDPPATKPAPAKTPTKKP